VAEMACLLAEGLKNSGTIDWDSLKDRRPFTKPRPRQPDKPQLRPEPKPRAPEFRCRRVYLLDDLLSWWRYRKVKEVRARFRKTHAYWEQERQELAGQYAAAIQQFQRALAQWTSEEQAFRAAQQARNSAVDEQRQRYASKDSETIVEYCEMVLSRSEYPESFPQQVDLNYDAETHTLIADCEVPALDAMPIVKEVKYVKSRDELVDVPLRAADVEKMYDSVLYQIALRTIHELFRADVAGAIEVVVFNGWLCSTDKTTGHPGCWCIMSLQANRDEFTAINLANVDPRACFKTLKGVAGAKLYSLTPITPIRQTSGENKRFVPSGDLVPRRPHLAVLPRPAPRRRRILRAPWQV
jgi:restriction system protein